MRARFHLRSFLRDRHGISSVEFAIVVPVFLLFIFGIIDMSRAQYIWNQAETATQNGARAAIVSGMLATGLDFDGVPLAGGAGIPVPVSAVNNGDPVVCTSDGSAVTCNAYQATKQADATRAQDAFDTILAAMRRAYPDLQPDQVEVSYQHVGLGFAGNPGCADIVPNVTVRIVNAQINLVTTGLIGLSQWPMPDFATTLTGEAFGCGSV